MEGLKKRSSPEKEEQMEIENVTIQNISKDK